MSKEAMKLALEALKQIDEAMPFPVAKLAQAALREALAEQPAQQKPEPPSNENITDAWVSASDSDGVAYDGPSFERGYRLGRGEYDEYTGALVAAALAEQPAQRTWVGLTDEEITDIWAEASPYYHEDDFARAIEAKLKEKNT